MDDERTLQRPIRSSIVVTVGRRLFGSLSSCDTASGLENSIGELSAFGFESSPSRATARMIGQAI